MNPATANYDEPWKEALSEYFEAFLHCQGEEIGALQKSRDAIKTVLKVNATTLIKVPGVGIRN